MSFTNWPPLRGTVQTNSSSTAIASFLALRRSRDWSCVWRPALRHPRYGNPPVFLPYPWTNPITVQHAGHLHFFHKATGRRFFDADCVVDLGAGYGSMCRLVRRLGFGGRYLIFDQPPMLAIQRYFLALNGIDSAYGDRDQSRVALFDRIEDLIGLVDRAEFERISILSTWALSEMPIGLRNAIDPLFSKSFCKSILLAYQSDLTYVSGFGDINNPEYFDSLLRRHSEETEGWNWTKAAVPYHSDGNYYLFGTR